MDPTVLGFESIGKLFLKLPNEHGMSDHLQNLRALAPVLDRLQADPNARVNYELMSDALIWSDELPPPSEQKGGEANGMRGVFRFRTTLILGKPEERFRAGWEMLRTLCPHWPGFLAERQQPDPGRIQFFEEARAKLIEEWEALDARFEKQRSKANEKPAPVV